MIENLDALGAASSLANSFRITAKICPFVFGQKRVVKPGFEPRVAIPLGAIIGYFYQCKNRSRRLSKGGRLGANFCVENPGWGANFCLKMVDKKSR